MHILRKPTIKGVFTISKVFKIMTNIKDIKESLLAIKGLEPLNHPFLMQNV